MSRLAAVTGSAAAEELAATLTSWLPQQRWYAGKARDLDGLRVVESALVDDVLDVIVEVAYRDGGTQRYQVPLAAAPAGAAHDVAATAAGVTLADALADPAACRTLARLATCEQRHATSGGGALVGRPVTGEPVGDGAPARPMPGEQSNTSVVLDERLVLKVFRKLETGRNPDVEVTGALTAAGCAEVPAQHGSLELHGADGTTALAVVAEFVAGGRGGWELALADLQAAAGLRPAPWPRLLDVVAELGAAVARTHVALAEVFGRQTPDAAATSGWVTAMREQLDTVMSLASRRAPEETAAALARAEVIAERFDALAELADPGPLVRIHGDLHLGQVLYDAKDRWRLLDFEGEPARSLAQRRAHHCPVRDVAGMLRSFDYAAAQVAAGGHRENWHAAARRRLLSGYRGVARPAGLLPADPQAERTLLHAFELDKAVYELGYELANRPDWVVVPVGGILRALDRAAAAEQQEDA